MHTLPHPSMENAPTPQPRRPKRRGFSPLMLVGMIVTLIIAMGAGAFLLYQPLSNAGATNSAKEEKKKEEKKKEEKNKGGKQQEEPNPNCSLIVPNQPLTAQGLATPYQLIATNPKDGPCNEANPDQGAFVQAAVINPETGEISIYNPLVIDRGTQPAAPPVVPELPEGGVVGIWFGYNGDTLTLRGAGVKNGNCVNGLQGSPFGQVAFCNAAAFFEAANQAIADGKIEPPPLGTGKDGLTCSSVRDFFSIDQDQSDNVTTTYLADKQGRIAQHTKANLAKMPKATVLSNGSDNLVVSKALAGALDCQSWMAPDLADPGNMLTSQPLNELQAAAHQVEPVALIPAGDPMVLVNGEENLEKLNAYRLGVNMEPVENLDQASTAEYCQNFLDIAPERMLADAEFTKASPSPDAGAANNLFTFLAFRFNNSWGAEIGLDCEGLLGIKSPIVLKTNNQGVVVDATINGQGGNGGNGGGNGNGNGGNGGGGNGDKSVDCVVNGKNIAGCQGVATINGQMCVFRHDKAANKVTVTCQANEQ